jgi:hypothetical protein
MFGSTILDVAVGLVFLFLAVSLAASAITEAISSALKLRHTTLRDGIGRLLNDRTFTGTALTLYNHALVNPLAQGTATNISGLKTLPAYIPSRNFALALLHGLEVAAPAQAAPVPAGGNAAPPAPAPAAGNPAPPAPARTLAQLVAEVQDPQLKQALTTLLADAQHDRDAFVAAIGDWFDAAMDRVTGWYKRYTQLIGAIVAFVICAILNADALRIGTALWTTPTLADELKVANSDQVTRAIGALDQAGLLGWSPGTSHGLSDGIGPFFLMLLGWLIVTGASLFGAPFWFDTLQRFVQLGGTGPDLKGSKRARPGPRRTGDAPP